MIGRKLNTRFGVIFATSMLLLVVWRLEQNRQAHLKKTISDKWHLSDLTKNNSLLSTACQDELSQLRRGLLNLVEYLEGTQWNTNVQLVAAAANLTKQAYTVCEDYWLSPNQIAPLSFLEQPRRWKEDTLLNFHSENVQSVADPRGIQTESLRQPLNDRFLRYCLNPLDEKINRDIYQTIHRHLSEYSGYTGTCSDNSSQDNLLVTLGWTERNRCGFQTAANSATDFKCLVILPTFESVVQFNQDVKVSQLGLGNAVVAAAVFYPTRYRRHIDVPLVAMTLHEVYDQLTVAGADTTRPMLVISSFGRSSQVAVVSPTEALVINKLKAIATQKTTSNAYLVYYDQQHSPIKCWRNERIIDLVLSTPLSSPWFPCSDAPNLLRSSIFGLVLGSSLFSETNDIHPGDLSFQLQLLLCLKSGSIPVVIGDGAFPFPEAIGVAHWTQAVLRLPVGQIDRMLPLLSAMSATRIAEMQYHGQLIFLRHFVDLRAQLSTLMLEIGNRYGLAQQPVPEYYTKLVQTPSPHVTYHTLLSTTQHGYLNSTGPAKFPLDTTADAVIQRVLIGPSDSWKLDPFHAYPTTPWHGVDKMKTIPEKATTAQMASSPVEQFTTVILYYERLDSIVKMLSNYSNLTTLHSVVIVWNHPTAPNATIQWPKMACSIKVLYGLKNSLNNRFLPLDLIQTDAVLSLDDDSRLTIDEINFGFRVWKENREKLVGYPARSHGKSQDGKKSMYVTKLSCAYSMVLTGATFLHRYYMFAYTWLLPSAVFQMVDRRMNCEDIAMNFLVSHTVRRPPIKVTNRSIFVCHDCPNKGLNDRKNHYKERSVCIDELVNIYGYNPLIYTSYRAERFGQPTADCR